MRPIKYQHPLSHPLPNHCKKSHQNHAQSLCQFLSQNLTENHNQNVVWHWQGIIRGKPIAGQLHSIWERAFGIAKRNSSSLMDSHACSIHCPNLDI